MFAVLTYICAILLFNCHNEVYHRGETLTSLADTLIEYDTVL